MIYSSRSYSRPEPNPEREATIRETLKRLDASLDVHWYPVVAYNEQYDTYEGRYALVFKWQPNDPRWQLVQSGEVSERDAVDIIGWFCTDMQDGNSAPVNVDEVENLVLKLLSSCDNTRFPAKERMRQVSEKNAKLRRDRRQEMLDMTEDEARYYFAGTSRGGAIVPVLTDLASNGGN